MRQRVKEVRCDYAQGVEQQRGIERVEVHRREEVFVGVAAGASGVRACGLVALKFSGVGQKRVGA